jgi:hypothetical protein
MNPADMNSLIVSASFVLNSLLVCIGLLIIVMAILVADNLVHRYWKPVKLVSYVNQDSPESADAKPPQKEPANK